MTLPTSHTAVMARAYVAQYVDPISVQRGEVVRVEREDPELPGWWWCEAADGRGGWVPGELLLPTAAAGVRARLSADYTARELTVESGTTVEVLEERVGWLFVRAEGVAPGWVPLTHVARRPRA